MKKALLTLAMVAAASPSFAALDLTGVTVDTASVYTLGATVIAGLAGIWGVRKVVKFINRS